jgi:hypothetical protein
VQSERGRDQRANREVMSIPEGRGAEDLFRSMAFEEDPLEFSASMGIPTGPGVVGVAGLAAA